MYIQLQIFVQIEPTQETDVDYISIYKCKLQLIICFRLDDLVHIFGLFLFVSLRIL